MNNWDESKDIDKIDIRQHTTNGIRKTLVVRR